MRVPLSVVILAKNEESRIKDCLDSVHGWADEIVVMDDESTDNTRVIAAQYTNSIFIRYRDLEGRQRNIGDAKAKNDWVMLLDCDERVTDELKQEIAAVLKDGDPKVVAYWAPQVNYMGDVQLNHGGWSTPHIRLYNKRYAKWNEAEHYIIHPVLKIVEGYSGKNLKCKTIHYSFRNVDDFITKINFYSRLDAAKWYLDGRKMSLGKALWRSWDRFFRRFIAKKGYKDGYYGFVAAVLSGFQEFATYSKYKEIKEKGYYISEIQAKVRASQAALKTGAG